MQSTNQNYQNNQIKIISGNLLRSTTPCANYYHNHFVKAVFNLNLDFQRKPPVI